MELTFKILQVIGLFVCSWGGLSTLALVIYKEEFNTGTFLIIAIGIVLFSLRIIF